MAEASPVHQARSAQGPPVRYYSSEPRDPSMPEHFYFQELKRGAGRPQGPVVTAGEEDAGQRLDNFLFRTLKGVPKSHVYRLLRTGQVGSTRSGPSPITAWKRAMNCALPPVRQAEKSQPRPAAPLAAGGPQGSHPVRG